MNANTEVKHHRKSGRANDAAPEPSHHAHDTDGPWRWAAAVGRLLFAGPWSLGSDWTVTGSHGLDRDPAAGGETWRWS